MFKKHALQIRMVNDSTNNSENTEVFTTLDPEQISKIAKDQVVNAAVAIGVVAVAVIAAKTVSEIVINVANPANWK